MVEVFRIPFHERKISPVVFGVAPRTLLIGTRSNVIRSMQPALGSEARSDLSVTVQAFEGCFATALMAIGAVGGSVQRGMRL